MSKTFTIIFSVIVAFCSSLIAIIFPTFIKLFPFQGTAYLIIIIYALIKKFLNLKIFIISLVLSTIFNLFMIYSVEQAFGAI